MQGPGRSRAVGMRGRWGSNGGGGAGEGEGGYRYHRRQQQPGMYPLGWELQHLAYAQQQEAQQYYVQALLQPQIYGRAGVSSRGGFLPLGVQAPGILKRPAGPARGPLLYGRGHARGGGGQQRGRGLGNERVLPKPYFSSIDDFCSLVSGFPTAPLCGWRRFVTNASSEEKLHF